MYENTTRQDASAHDRQIREMFSGIATVYDRMNGILSLGLDARWRRALGAAIDPKARELLDVCCGTGELILSARAAGKGSAWHASDFCEPMLRAGVRDHGLTRQSSAVVADTQSLPYRDESFDAVMAAFGLRNLGDLPRGLREIRRVLRPGGQLLVLEFFRARRSGPARMLALYLARVVPLLGRLIGRDASAYRYLPESMGRFLSVTEFARLLAECGFETEIRSSAQSFGVAHLVVARRSSEAISVKHRTISASS